MAAMRAWMAAAAVGLLILVGGCSSKSSEGTVEGRLLMVGGPPPGVQLPAAGTVIIKSSGGTRITVKVRADGRFKRHVPEGSYSLTGRSPQYNSSRVLCSAAHPVKVRVGSSVSRDVLCQMM
jgi:hypothetical protein